MSEDSTPRSKSEEKPSSNQRFIPTSVIKAALRRSLDEALKSAGLNVPAPKEQALVDRVSQEVTIAFEQTTSAIFQGPMPPPEILQGYEDVVPGLARQIAKMAIDEQQHRHQWERRALWNDIFAQSGGLWLGWLLAAGCACGSFYLAYNGNNIGAGILLSVVVVSLVRTFAGANRKQSSDIPNGSEKNISQSASGSRH